MTPIYSVQIGWSSAQATEALLGLCEAKEPILDATYGRGQFWKGSTRSVIGLDLITATDVRGSFIALPFRDCAFPTVIYDPPYHPSGSNSRSIEVDRFGSLGRTSFQSRPLFVKGLHECWRVTSNILLVKCQHFINENQVQWMPLWAISELGYPYEWLVTVRNNKRVSSTWRLPQMSLYRNHADYLVWRKLGHVRRRSRRDAEG